MRGGEAFAFPKGSDKVVYANALAGGTDKDIAAHFGCLKGALQHQFKRLLKKARADRRLLIQRAQMKYALKGQPALLIWLGKQPLEKGGLNQKDQLVLGDVDVTKLNDEELEKARQGKLKPRRPTQGATLRVIGGGRG